MSVHGLADAAGDPVRVWGDLSSVYRERDYIAGEVHSMDWLNVATINASSYIWEPWFALVNGGLSLSSDKKWGDGTGQPATNDQYIDGNFRLSIFPASRFPFQFYASKSKNEFDEEVFGRTIDNTVVGVRQHYTSLDRRSFYSGNIERNKRDDLEQDSFVRDSFTFSARNRLENNILSAGVEFDNREQPNEDSEKNYSITGRHTFTGSRSLTIDNVLSSSQSHSDFISSSSVTENNQLFSFASWRPGQRTDLNVTGNLRVSGLTQSFENQDPSLASTSDITSSELAVVNINQGLIYNYNPSVTITESINGTQSETEGVAQFGGSESIGVRYNSDYLKISMGRYSWHADSNFNRTHGDSVSTESALNNQLGHSLSKEIVLATDIKLQSRFNQAAGYNIRTSRDNARTMNHSMTVSWSEVGVSNRPAIRFLAADNRVKDIDEQQFLILNLQISNDYRFNRYNHFLVNLTLQKSVVTTGQDSTESSYGNGRLNYINNRFFNVMRLSFRTELNYSRKVSDSQNDTLNASDSEYNNSWKNELVYRVGLLSTRFNLDYVKNGDVYDRILKIQFTRNFGDL